MMMTYEDYKQLMELVQKRDEETEEIRHFKGKKGCDLQRGESKDGGHLLQV